MIVSTSIYVIVFEIILYKLGESGSYDKIINEQIKYNVLLGRKLGDVQLEYKIIGTKIIKPEVLILGTSRIMQFKHEFFQPQTMYNAGVAASISRGLKGMKTLLDAVNESTYISYIIIGLDPWIFNPNYPENKTENIIKNKIKNILSSTPYLFSVLRKIKLIISSRPRAYQQLITKEYSSLHYLFEERRVNGFGLASKMHDSGYRFDGSRQYAANHQANWIDQSVISYMHSLEEDNYRFPPASNIYYNSLTELKQLLDYAKSRKIKVIGFLPPFAPNFYKALTTMDNRAMFMKKYETEVCETFVSSGFKCYNYSDISKYSKLDNISNDFYDYMHPGPILMNEISLSILNDLHD